MVSYFTCDQVASDPKDPTNYYNDANWCDKEYDALYKQQKVETDRAKREDLIHQMLLRLHDARVYQVLYVYPDTQAYVKGRFTGFQRQPEKTGPVLYSNSSPSYATLAPATATGGGGSSDDGGGSGGLIAIIVAAVLVVGGIAFMLMRRRTAYERE
jgi:peptide/nickel transport system substrate-binding protein